MTLFILLALQCCANAICGNLYHLFFSLLVPVSVSGDEISTAFLCRLLRRMYQLSQTENISLHPPTILFLCFNCHSITPNYILLFRKPYKSLSHVLFIHPEITQISVLTALGSYQFLLGMT